MSKKVTYDEFVQLLDRKGKITFIWPDSKEFNIWKDLAEVDGKPVQFLATDNYQYNYYVYVKDFKIINDYFIKNNYYETYDNITAILNQDGINFIHNNPPFKIFQEFYEQIYAQPEGKIDTFKTAVAPYGNSYKSYLLGEEYFIDLENAIRYTKDKYVEILDEEDI